MLNWIVWNGTVFDCETEYLCLTGLFEIVGWLVGWIFIGYQPLYVIWCQIYFYTNNQFYFKQLSLAQFDSHKHSYFKLFSLVKHF